MSVRNATEKVKYSGQNDVKLVKVATRDLIKKYPWVKGLERTVDVSVTLEDTEDDVEQPEEEEEGSWEELGHPGTAQLRLPEDGEEPPGHEEGDGGDGTEGVDDDTEGQSPRIDNKASLRVL